MRLALLAVMLLAPTAAALDAFPTETKLGATEARFLVRLPQGGHVTVEANASVRVALVAPGAAAPALSPAPATLAPPRAPEWHGLGGVYELVVQRDDPRQDVGLLVEDGTTSGLALDWPAAPPKRVPAAGAALAVLALAWCARRWR